MTSDDKDGDFWVFGYGSLMWRPGFPFLDSRRARVTGLHRSLCVFSWFHRGTQERPGLVLGLDRGGACLGLAFRVSGREREGVIEYLREREQVTNVYLERWHSIRFPDGSQDMALAYVVDRSHPQYAGKLHPDEQIALIERAAGQSGANPDYVTSTVQRLGELGIPDRGLFRISQRLAAVGE